MTIWLQKAVINKQKYLLGWLFVFLQPVCLVLQGQWILFCSHTYSSSVVLVCKKKIMIFLLYFELTRSLVFTNCPTVMLKIGDCSIKITQLDIKLKGRTDSTSLKIMSVLSSGLWYHFLTKSSKLQVTEVEMIYSIQIFVRGEEN